MKKIETLQKFLRPHGRPTQKSWLASDFTMFDETNKSLNFSKNYLLLSAFGRVSNFPALEPAFHSQEKRIKGLINQTKWLIYQTQQSLRVTANRPQEAFLWI